MTKGQPVTPEEKKAELERCRLPVTGTPAPKAFVDALDTACDSFCDPEPPFPGRWVRREDVPGGLDAAKGDLMRICFYDPTDYPQWHIGGFRTGDVQHFVNIAQ
jgi:hypothetical protein